MMDMQQVKLEIEKLTEQLNLKSDEICEIRRMCEELRSSSIRLQEKYGDKFLGLQMADNDLERGLAAALTRIELMEDKVCKHDVEIAGHKRQKAKAALVDGIALPETAQALAHQESRGKFIEMGLSKSVFTDSLKVCFQKADGLKECCQGARSEVEQLIMMKDEQIADLRSLLSTKDKISKEMQDRIAQLWNEYNCLSVTNEDLQQDQVNDSMALKKLRDELHNLEKLHDKCAADMKEKEAEWNLHIEKLKEDLRYRTSELDDKSRSIQDAYKELDDSQYMLEVKNEEMSVIIMVLKSDFHIAYSELVDAKEKLEMKTKELKDKSVDLERQLLGNTREILHKVTDRLSDASNSGQSDPNEDDLCKKLELQKKENEQVMLKFGDYLKARNAEMEKLKSQSEEVRTSFEVLIKELKSQKQVLLTKLDNDPIDRDILLLQLGSISNQIEELSRDGVGLG